MKEKKEQAVDLFKEGYNCAQSVITVFGDTTAISRETSLKVASGFGGGMGGMQKTCGAVTAAVMVIGSYFYSQEKYDGAAMKEAIREFFRMFAAKHGASSCRELTGYDMNDPVQKSQALSENVYGLKCNGFIRDSVEIIESILPLEENN